VTVIACQQIAPRVADLPGNVARATDAVASAVADGADVIVLPELATSGYVFDSREEAASLAVTADAPLFESWARVAGRAVVVAGFCERGDDGELYNSATVVTADGVQAVYRKTHLWDREKLVFSAGNRPPPVIATPHGRLGVLVCYDLEFPELTRSLALRGAELLVVPTNWPAVPRPEGERAPEVVIAMAAARVNRCFIACCDRVGTERGQAWTGGTTIVDEQGWVVAETDGEGCAMADVELGRARTKALTPLSDALGDRRPELYGALTEPTS
jgi:5-aminopentanamidase